VALDLVAVGEGGREPGGILGHGHNMEIRPEGREQWAEGKTPSSTLIFLSPKHIIVRWDRHQEELCPFENPVGFRSGWEESLSL